MEKSQAPQQPQPPLYPPMAPMEEMGPPPPYFLEGEVQAHAPLGWNHQQQPYLPPQHSPQVGGVAAPLINSHNPLRMECPHCKEDIKTVVSHETGLLTHVAAGVLCPFCLLFCCIPCCIFPYCSGQFKDTIHQCPKCKKHLGLVKRL